MAGISLDMDNVNISPSSEDSLDEKMMVYSDDDDF